MYQKIFFQLRGVLILKDLTQSIYRVLFWRTSNCSNIYDYRLECQYNYGRGASNKCILTVSQI